MSLATKENVERWLIEALAHGGDTHGLEDIYEAIRSGEAQIWLGERSVVVTRVDVFPRAKVISTWAGGGDLSEIVGVLRPQIEAFGVEQGCDRLMILSRPGWIKALGGDGYREAARMCVKELR